MALSVSLLWWLASQPVRQQLWTKLITDSDGLSPQFWHGKKAFLNDNLLKEHTGILRTMLGIDSWKLNTFLGVKGPMDKISCLSIQIQSALIFGFRVYHYCLNKSQDKKYWDDCRLCCVLSKLCLIFMKIPKVAISLMEHYLNFEHF